MPQLIDFNKFGELHGEADEVLKRRLARRNKEIWNKPEEEQASTPSLPAPAKTTTPSIGGILGLGRPVMESVKEAEKNVPRPQPLSKPEDYSRPATPISKPPTSSLGGVLGLTQPMTDFAKPPAPSKSGSLLQTATGGFKTGWYGTELGLQEYEKMWGRPNKAEEYQKTLQEHPEWQEQEPFKWSDILRDPLKAVNHAVRGAAHTLALMLNLSTKAAVPAALAGIGVAAGAAKAGLGQKEPRLDPTTAFLTSAPLAAQLGLQAANVIFTANQIQNMAKVEASDAYKEYVDSGVSPQVARAAAEIAGWINGTLEHAQFGELLGAGAAGREALKQLKKNTLTAALKNVVKKWAEGVNDESLEEAAQETVTVIGKHVANTIDEHLKSKSFNAQQSLEGILKSKDLYGPEVQELATRGYAALSQPDNAFNRALREVATRAPQAYGEAALSFGLLQIPGIASGVGQALYEDRTRRILGNLGAPQQQTQQPAPTQTQSTPVQAQAKEIVPQPEAAPPAVQARPQAPTIDEMVSRIREEAQKQDKKITAKSPRTSWIQKTVKTAFGQEISSSQARDIARRIIATQAQTTEDQTAVPTAATVTPAVSQEAATTSIVPQATETAATAIPREAGEVAPTPATVEAGGAIAATAEPAPTAPTPTAERVPPSAIRPWEMRLDEYYGLANKDGTKTSSQVEAEHREIVSQALKEGRQVPYLVLADHPALITQAIPKDREAAGDKIISWINEVEQAGLDERSRETNLTRLYQQLGYYTTGVRLADAEETGRLYRALKQGEITQEEWDNHVAQLISENRIKNRSILGIGESQETSVPKTGTTVPREESVSAPQTGRPFSAELYHGSGKPKSEIYAYLEKPIAGEGKYYAFTNKDAEFYGDKITQEKVTLNNPLVITNDAEWRELTQEAGWEYPNPFGSSKDKVSQWIDQLKSLILSKGHDSLIVAMDKRGDLAKTLGDVFGHDQVVVYPEAQTRKADIKPEGAPTTVVELPKQAEEQKSTPQEQAPEERAAEQQKETKQPEAPQETAASHVEWELGKSFELNIPGLSSPLVVYLKEWKTKEGKHRLYVNGPFERRFGTSRPYGYYDYETGKWNGDDLYEKIRDGNARTLFRNVVTSIAKAVGQGQKTGTIEFVERNGEFVLKGTEEAQADERKETEAGIPLPITGLDRRLPLRSGEGGQRYQGIVITRGRLLDEGRGYALNEKASEVLRPHQQDGVNLAVAAIDTYGGFILADGTGAGKTLQELAIADYYARQGKRVLIVTPNRTIISTAFRKDASLLGVEVNELTGDKQVAEPGKINITTYSSLGKLSQSETPEYVVFDESHYLKNPGTAQSRKGLALASQAKGVLFASATPLDKAEQILYLRKLGVFKKRSYDDIMKSLGYSRRELTRGRVKITVWERSIPLPEAEKKLEAFFNELAEVGLITKREVSMDKVDVYFRTINLPQEAHDQLDKIEAFFAQKFGDVSGIHKANMVMTQRRFQEPHKIEETIRLTEQELREGRQVVIFASRIEESELVDEVKEHLASGEWAVVERIVVDTSEGTLKSLADRLEKAGHEVAHIFGTGKVDDEIRKFQEGKAKVALVTPQKGGAGLSLDDTMGNAPRTMVVMTLPFSGVDSVQMAGRINRLNTKSRSRVIYLLADTVVDEWNKGIITEKMSALKATVKGDISKLEVKAAKEFKPPSFEERLLTAPVKELLQELAQGFKVSGEGTAISVSLDEASLKDAELAEQQEKELRQSIDEVNRKYSRSKSFEKKRQLREENDRLQKKLGEVLVMQAELKRAAVAAAYKKLAEQPNLTPGQKELYALAATKQASPAAIARVIEALKREIVQISKENSLPYELMQSLSDRVANDLVSKVFSSSGDKYLLNTSAVPRGAIEVHPLAQVLAQTLKEGSLGRVFLADAISDHLTKQLEKQKLPLDLQPKDVARLAWDIVMGYNGKVDMPHENSALEIITRLYSKEKIRTLEEDVFLSPTPSDAVRSLATVVTLRNLLVGDMPAYDFEAYLKAVEDYFAALKEANKHAEAPPDRIEVKEYAPPKSTRRKITSLVAGGKGIGFRAAVDGHFYLSDKIIMVEVGSQEYKEESPHYPNDIGKNMVDVWNRGIKNAVQEVGEVLGVQEGKVPYVICRFGDGYVGFIKQAFDYISAKGWKLKGRAADDLFVAFDGDTPRVVLAPRPISADMEIVLGDQEVSAPQTPKLPQKPVLDNFRLDQPVSKSMVDPATKEKADAALIERVKEGEPGKYLPLVFSPQKTSVKQIARGLRVGVEKGVFKSGMVVADVGGGLYDDGTRYLEEHGITNLVYDPYARAESHNNNVIASIESRGGADAVALNNVLNVIPKVEDRTSVLKFAYSLLKDGGQMIITVYQGDGSGKGAMREFKDGTYAWQENRRLESYEEEITQALPGASVERKYGAFIVTKKPRSGAVVDANLHALTSSQRSKKDEAIIERLRRVAKSSPVPLASEDILRRISPKATRKMVNIIGKAINAAVRRGRLHRAVVRGTRGKLRGVYDVGTHAIRIHKKAWGDWRTMGHELSHALMHFTNSRPDQREMAAIARRFYPEKPPVGRMTSEGFADFMALWFADNLQARELAPRTAQMIDRILEGNPQLKKAFDTALKIAVADQEASGLDRWNNYIYTRSEKLPEPVGGEYRIESLLKRGLFEAVDFTIPLKDMMRAATEHGYEGLDFSKLAAISGTAWKKAVQWIKEKPRDFAGRLLLPEDARSLGDIIREAEKLPGGLERLDQVYHVLRYYERWKKGFEPPVPVQDLKADVEEIMTKHYEMAKLVREYATTLSEIRLRMLVRSGIISQETAKRVQQGSDFYLPLITPRSALGETTLLGEKDNRAAGQPVKQYSPSADVTLDFLEASVHGLYQVAVACELNRVMQSIHKALSKKGMGLFGEIIDSPKVLKIINAAELSNQLQKQLEQFLEGDLDLNEDPSQIFIKLFLPGTIKDAPFSEPIIMARYGNKKVYMRVAPDIYKSVLAMRPITLNLAQKALAQMGRISRAGALFNVRYITNNLMRDILAAQIQTESPQRLFVVSSLKGAAAAAGLDPDSVDLYIQSGAYGSAPTEFLESAVRSYKGLGLYPTRASGWVRTAQGTLIRLVHTPADAVRILEEGTRIAEFEAVLRKRLAKIEKKTGKQITLKDVLQGKYNPDLKEAVELALVDAAYASHEVTTNFALHGAASWIRGYVQIVPFLHGSIQGMYRVGRQFAEKPATTLARIGLYLIPLTIMAFAVNHDEPEYEDIPSQARDRYWFFPIRKGFYVAFAKPYEYCIPINIMERFLGWAWNKSDPMRRKPLEDLGKMLRDQFSMPLIPLWAEAIMALAMNKDSFGSPIVPMSEKDLDPELQYSPTKNSKAAIEMSRLMAKLTKGQFVASPRQIDFLIENTLGGIGKTGMSIVSGILNKATGKPEGRTWQWTLDYNPVFGSLVYGPAEGGSRIVDRFYRDMERANRKYQSWAETQKTGKKMATEITTEDERLVMAYPAMKAISNELAKERAQLVAMQSDPNISAEAKEQAKLRYNWLSKVAAGFLYGAPIPTPHPKAGITPAEAEDALRYFDYLTRKAVVNALKRPGGPI